ncbi:MAG: hypothetical protein MZV64_65070 [Ignavibacteriales bacterium]|nr:hypothetical protein [Ignavibacteriales bacterium]
MIKLDFLKNSTIYSFITNHWAWLNFFTTSPEIKVKDGDYPAKAIEFIKINNLKGNLLVPFNWGSYAFWKLYPRCLVSIDGRFEEVYPNEVYHDISNFTFYYKGWEKALEKYKNDIILIETGSKTLNELMKVRDWALVYTR